MTRNSITRRGFLWGSAALAVQLASCGRGDRPPLTVQFLQNSMPTELIQAFVRRLGRPGLARFEPLEQLQDAFRRLQTTETPTGANWMTLGDAWLTAAIQEELIRPVPTLTTLDGWATLPQPWQALVQRDRQGRPQSDGEIWGAPYRWGSLVLVYSVAAMERLGWVPSQWDDLWRSDLERRISVPDSARVVIGLLQQQAGGSPNQDTLEPTVAERLQALHQQVRFYSSNAYLEPLLRGDTWAAVGWSTDVLPFIQRDRRLRAVIPDQGTLLFADLWVAPALAPPAPDPDLLLQWIDFCWQPEIAERLTSLSLATSPQLTARDEAAIATVMDAHPLLWPGDDILARSEWLGPLPSEAIAAYRELWTRVREMG
jgi:putative spermidine/putrescine transport system substrate-binding protein